ncbi:MAG: DUF3592 domain-containing protein [Anaerolineae bacterium]|nr:DUF3592 domain-containing protein [Anaerolineae bacterium]
MLKGSCPDCGSPIQIDKGAASFGCPACGARFEFVEKNGRRVARRVQSANPIPPPVRPVSQPRPVSRPVSPPSNPFSREKRDTYDSDPSYYSWSSSLSPYGVPPPGQTLAPAATSTRTSTQPQRLEILLRVDRFLLLLLLLLAIPLLYPAYLLSFGYQDITLPGIGTLESRPKIEQSGKTTTTTAYVTEARIMETRRSRGGTTTDYEVRYQFQVNGVWYTHADDTGRTNLWKPIDKAVWDRVYTELETVGQSTIQVKYVTADPWDNRPLDSGTTHRMQWLFLFFGLGFAGLTGLSLLYSAIRNYFLAREVAANGRTGTLRYWEVVPKK